MTWYRPRIEQITSPTPDGCTTCYALDACFKFANVSAQCTAAGQFWSYHDHQFLFCVSPPPPSGVGFLGPISELGKNRKIYSKYFCEWVLKLSTNNNVQFSLVTYYIDKNPQGSFFSIIKKSEKKSFMISEKLLTKNN